MNTKNLGDAKDLAKAFLFRFLREKLQIQIKVVPFFTGDKKGVNEKEKEIKVILPTYASILGILQQDVLLRDRVFSHKGRKKYIGDVIKEIETDRSIDTLFLDPDTGIKNRASKKVHVPYKELRSLLDSEKKPLLIVYDESFGGKKNKNKKNNKKKIPGILKALRQKLRTLRNGKIQCFGYYGGAFNLIFLANAEAKGRLKNIKKALGKFLELRSDRIE